MKIIHFVPSLRTGGAETIATNSAIEQKRLGQDVICLVYDGDYGDSPNKKALISSDIKICFLSDRKQWYYKSNNILYRIVRLLIRKHSIVKTIRQTKPDVVHFHLTPFITIYHIAKKFPRIHLYYTIHSEITSIFRDHKNVEYAKKTIKQGKITIIALHERMKEECAQLLDCPNVICINNGIDLQRFRVGSERENYRKKLGIKKQDFVVGHIGSLSPVKNHEYLFRVFHSVLQHRADAWLLLIGEGYLKEQLFNYSADIGIQDRIIWLEKRNDIPELLSCMDVFVFPSHYEGYPLAVIEAQAAGVRCLISDTITDEVLVTDHIKKMDISMPPDIWSEEILNPTQYKAYSGIESYDIKLVAKQLNKLYSGVLS